MPFQERIDGPACPHPDARSPGVAAASPAAAVRGATAVRRATRAQEATPTPEPTPVRAVLPEDEGRRRRGPPTHQPLDAGAELTNCERSLARYQADSDDAPTSATGPSDAGTRPNTIPYGRYMEPRGLASTERAASTPAHFRWAGMPRTRPANSASLGVRLGIHRAQPRSAQNKANDASAWGGWSIGHALRWARSRAGNHRTRPPERSDGLKKRSHCADRHHAHQPAPS
jgi:hypothetical protein